MLSYCVDCATVEKWLGYTTTPTYVFDCSWLNLPVFEGRDAQEEFNLSRIPGAEFFDLDICRDTSTTLPHMLPSLTVFETYLAHKCRRPANNGCSPLVVDAKKDRFVLYDSMGVWSSPRVWWMFHVFGLSHVYVLNGGLPEWIAQNKPLDTSTYLGSDPTAQQPSRVVNLQFDGESVAKYNDITELQNFCLIDARPVGRFEGRDPEPRAGLPSGHIPGSKNLPWTDVVDAVYCQRESCHLTGVLKQQPDSMVKYLYYRYKNLETLQRVFKEHELLPQTTSPIIMMCGSGVSAVIVLLAYLLAHESALPWTAVKLYDGSWTEWKLRSMGVLP